MELEELIQQERDREAALADRLDELQSELEGELGRLGAYEALSAQLTHNKEGRKREARYRVDCIVTLAGNLESADLRGILAYSATSQMLKFLQPLYKRGQIPLAHLPFVRGLLDAGLCVCGQDLTEGTYGHRVAGRVAEAEHEADRADYLYHLYQAALALSGVAGDVAWNEKRTVHAAELAACEQRLTELRTEARALNQKLSEIDEVRIQTLRDENAAVRKQLDTSAYRLRRYKDDLHELSEQIVSLDRTIAQRQRNARQAADHRAAEQMARHVVDILDKAYSRIQDRQVADLSEKMNSLFHQMAANVLDSDFDSNQRSRANIRMIVEVGVRKVEDRKDRFEIYALNGRGRAMPPVEINGASRRVLALSFVLALCDESNTRAPLIADSLLNSMSGTVRRNTLRVTSSHSRQPILLLTYSDLEARSEIDTVREYAGATYTLTAQWDAHAAGEGGDVVNRNSDHQVVLPCTCGPRQYCGICERIGHASTPGWSRRLRPEERA